MKSFRDKQYIHELVNHINDLQTCFSVPEVEAVFQKYHTLDFESKVFILYASLGECFTPDKYTLAQEDEYVLALGRFINHTKRFTRINADEFFRGYYQDITRGEA